SGPALNLLLDIHFTREAWAEAAPIAFSLSQHPDSVDSEARAELFRRRGVIAHHLGNRREAIESLKIALDIEPDNRGAFELLTEMLEGSEWETYSDFFVRLQQVLEKGDAPEALGRVKRYLAQHAEQRLNLNEALQSYTNAIALDRDSVPALRSLVRIQTRMRDFEQAVASCDEFSAGASKDDAKLEAQVLAASVVLDKLKDVDGARRRLDDVLKKVPQHIQACFVAAQAAFLSSEWARALDLMETVLAAHTDELAASERSEHHFYSGQIRRIGLSDPEGALRQFAKARELNPVDVRPLKAAALILLEQGNWSRLEKLLERAVKGAVAAGGDEAAAPFLLLTAKLWLHREEPSRAEDTLRELLERSPGHAEGKHLLVQLLQDAPQNRLSDLDALVAQNVFDVDALRGLAEALSATGDSAGVAWVERVRDVVTGQVRSSDAAVPLPRGQIRREELIEATRPKALETGFIELMRTLGAHMVELGFSVGLAHPSESRVLADEDVEAAAGLVTRALDFDTARIRCYSEGPSGPAVHVDFENGPMALVELAVDWTEPTDSRKVFLMAHGLALTELGTWPCQYISPADLTRLLWWLSRWHQSGSPFPPTDEAEWIGKTSEALQETLFDLLHTEGVELEPLRDPQHAQRVANGLEHASSIQADRVGLLATDDIVGAIDAILIVETGMGLAQLENPRPHLESSHRIRSLVEFSLSAGYRRLRAKSLETEG
ncbi:MAG: tetratricopeptide repeat protein, partial [Myxococcales bacterium]|nr:tetratricopeptide repeat protein [Myxococcales bacterium]